MLSPTEIIKILLLTPSVIFLFYGTVYLLIYELNTQPKLSKFYRNSSLVLIGGGALLLSIFFVV